MNRYRTGMVGVALLGAALVGGAVELAAQEPAPQASARARATVRVSPTSQPRGWFGFSYNAVEERGSHAVVVARVEPNTGAARGGLQVGDTIVRWADRSDVAAALIATRTAPGESVRLRVRRGGRDRDLTLVAGERPPGPVVQRSDDGRVIVITPDGRELAELSRRALIHVDSLHVHADSLHQRLRVMLRDSLGPRLQELERLRAFRFEIDADSIFRRGGPMIFELESGMRGVAGAEFTDLNPELSTYFNAERGVLVLRVAPETPAARAGLQAGDVVVRVNGQAVERVRDLRGAITRAQGRSAEMEVVRRGRTQTIRMSWD